MKTLEFNIDNFCLQVTQIGKGPATLVIGSPQYYSRTFSHNLTTKLQLIFTDTRGFAPNNPKHNPDDFTTNKMIQDIETIRASLNLDKIILIGHSIHAFLALEYARIFPNKVSHLVLIASSPIAGPEIYKESDQYFEESVCPQRKIAFSNKIQNFMHSNDQSFINRLIAFGPKIWYDYNFDAKHLWENVSINSIGANIIWGSMFINYNTAQALKTIECPILLILGRYDYFNPPHLWEKYRNIWQDLTIRIFEKSGHTPQLEEQENFDNELVHWLEQKITSP